MKDTINSYAKISIGDLCFTKIRVPTQDISEKVQKKLFKMGIKWNGEGMVVRYDASFLFITSTYVLQRCSTEEYFEEQRHDEIDYQDILGA